MKNCPQCNSLNDDLSTVCSSCGSDLNDANVSNSGTSNQFEMDNGSSSGDQFGMGNSPSMRGVSAKTNGLAIASMVLGIVSVVLSCCCGIVAIICGVLGIIMGIIGRNKIKASGGLEKGNGMAMAGIILGAIGASISVVGLILIRSGVIDWDMLVEELMKQNQQNLDLQ